ncbi:MAG: hypothetical protein IT424_00185 [Pirellulales bacterium]|nr:hypothetical protein [Pirellulales bacterium]
MGRLILALILCLAAVPEVGFATQGGALRLAVFTADVTPPIGHGMMGGSWLAKSINDPLEANGLIVLGDGQPVVFVSVDWCEIRNKAFMRWQEVLAQAVGTTPERVLLTTIHQHDAPVADLEAEQILRSRKLAGTVCDLDFHERAVQAVGRAAAASLSATQPLTHVGTGQARVERIASNRRYTLPDGSVRFDRMSSTRNPAAIAADEGLIDPFLKTLSFWSGEVPLAAVSFYAVHPMSYYGQGEVSADFPGIARRMRQQETPAVKQIYATGCSGNIVAGKYNTGARENRTELAQRLHDGMAAAWHDTRRHPIEGYQFRSAALRIEPRSDPGFTADGLEHALRDETDPFRQCLAAMGLSWRRRLASGPPIRIPVLDLGVAQLAVLPGEAYVEFQLAAQRMRPDSFVCVAGYGDGATGYIPTEQHFAEGDANLGDWCWVARGSQSRLLDALSEALVASGGKPQSPADAR